MASVLKRNIVLSLAEVGLYRPRWSERILDETERAAEKMIAKRGFADAAERAKRSRDQIDAAFTDALIGDYEMLEASLQNLPDPDDAHVVAVAIKTKASIIVTDNLKDFPAEVLDPFEIEAKTADDFIADTFDLSLPTALPAIRNMRERLVKPEFTTDALLLRMDEIGLAKAADVLRENQKLW